MATAKAKRVTKTKTSSGIKQPKANTERSSRPSKAQEVAELRAEVKKYIETGSSSTLTADERVKLYAQRQAYKRSQMPWYKREWENIPSLWKK